MRLGLMQLGRSAERGLKPHSCTKSLRCSFQSDHCPSPSEGTDERVRQPYQQFFSSLSLCRALRLTDQLLKVIPVKIRLTQRDQNCQVQVS